MASNKNLERNIKGCSDVEGCFRKATEENMIKGS